MASRGKVGKVKKGSQPKSSKQRKPAAPRRSGGIGGWIRRNFSHRRLITVEALLGVGLLDRLGRQWIIHDSPLPDSVRVLVLMLLVIGVFGGVLVFLERLAAGSLSRTHEVVQALPLPTPLIFIHAAVFVAMFFLYGWATDLDTTHWLTE